MYKICNADMLRTCSLNSYILPNLIVNVHFHSENTKWYFIQGYLIDEFVVLHFLMHRL